MGAAEFHFKPDEVRGFAKQVYTFADAVAKLRIDLALLSGAGACPGTDLVSRLQVRATEEHEGVQAISRDLDGFGESVLSAINSSQRLDERLPNAVPSTDRDA